MPEDGLKPAPTVQKSKRKLSFFSLPGELRNQIYGYYYAHTSILYRTNSQFEKGLHVNVQAAIDDQLSAVSRPNPSTLVSSWDYDLRRKHGIARNRLLWITDVMPHGLHLVSKQMWIEVLPLLCAATTIQSSSLACLSYVLTRAPGSHLKHINRLEIARKTYFPPRTADEMTWQEENKQEWEKAFTTAATAMVSLHSLLVVLYLRDEPLRFTTKEHWVYSLRPFYLHCSSLSNVKIVLSSPALEKVFARPPPNVSTEELRLTDPDLWSQVMRYEACKKVHELFGEVIAKKILAAGVAKAMKTYKAFSTQVKTKWNFEFIADDTV